VTPPQIKSIKAETEIDRVKVMSPPEWRLSDTRPAPQSPLLGRKNP
jgi:hypothetical protein